MVVETPRAAVGTDGLTGVAGTGAGAQEAAERAAVRGIITLSIAGRRLELLPREQIGFLAGVTLLAALEIIEWPVALVLAVGHTLAYRSQRAGLRSFGTVLGKG